MIKVKCPHCGNEQLVRKEWINKTYDGIEDVICKYCDKEFDIEIEFECYTKIAEYERCDCCKVFVKTREIFYKHKWLDFPSEYNKLCNECYTRKTLEKIRSRTI